MELRSAEVPICSPESVAASVHARVTLGEIELPLLPEAARRVVELAGDPDCDLRAVVDALRTDQALTAHLLRVANSPLCAPRTPIVSVQQACARLGIRQIRDLAMLVSVRAGLYQVAGWEAELRLWFRHAVVAAFFAQEIARTRRLNVEEAFLAGLVHDVGKPIALVAGAAAPAIPRPVTLEVVRRVHPEVGGALAHAWGFSSPIHDAIRGHHEARPQSVGVGLVQYADRLSHFALGTDDVEEATLRDHPVIELLNLYPEEVDDLLGRSEEAIAIARGVA